MGWHKRSYNAAPQPMSFGTMIFWFLVGIAIALAGFGICALLF